MKLVEKYDNIVSGVVSGFIFTIIIGLIVLVFNAHGMSLI